MISLNFTLQESKSHVTKGLLDRQDEAFPRIDVKMFSLHKLPKTLPGTTLLLFGPVTLLCRLKCGTLLFYLTSEQSVPLLRLWNYLRRQFRVVPSLPTCNFHTDSLDYRHMIPALKGQCEWDYWLFSSLTILLWIHGPYFRDVYSLINMITGVFVCVNVILYFAVCTLVKCTETLWVICSLNELKSCWNRFSDTEENIPFSRPHVGR